MSQTTRKDTRNIFQRPVFVAIFSLMAAVAWGWAYPLIKLGFEEFGITKDLMGSKILFAGIRFLAAGIIVLCLSHKPLNAYKPTRRCDWWFILLYALLNTTLHYTCFYIGLSHAEGARSAILNSLSVFLVVILACLFFRSDRMTGRKIVSCLCGFAGILTLNMGSANTGHFSWMGDGMIILNALCGATASLLTRGLSKRIDVFVGTGYSLAIGGLLLFGTGLILGGYLPRVSLLGLFYLVLLIGISTLGFSLYNKLISCNPVGKVAIYNSLIPVVGALTSCLCLGETFYWKYALAGGLTAAGIYLINKGKQ